MVFPTTTATPPAILATSLPSCAYNLYADALNLGPQGLSSLVHLASEQKLNTGTTAKDGLDCVLDGLSKMEPGLKAHGIRTDALTAVMQNIRTDRFNDEVSLSRLAAILKHIPPTKYREAINPLTANPEGWGATATFDIGSHIYADQLAVLSKEMLAKEEKALHTPPPASEFKKTFDVIAPIASKMALSYLVQEKETGDLYVAKSTRNLRKLDLMEREAQAMQNIDHENILPIYKSYRESDDSYILEDFIIVTPYIRHSETLAELLAKNHIFSEAEIISIMEQILSALRHLREKGIIHRDIKPSNILLTRNADGSLKARLFDFGVVKFTTDMTKTTDDMEGSVWWMAPEQLKDERLTTATDIHGLGLVLLALALGQTRENDVERQPVANDIERLRTKVAPGRFSEDLIRKIAMMLDANPNARMKMLKFASAQAQPRAATPATQALAAQALSAEVQPEPAAPALPAVNAVPAGLAVYATSAQLLAHLCKTNPDNPLAYGIGKSIGGATILSAASALISLAIRNWAFFAHPSDSNMLPPILHIGLFWVAGGLLTLLLLGWGSSVTADGVSSINKGNSNDKSNGPDDEPLETAYYHNGGYARRPTKGDIKYGTRINAIDKIGDEGKKLEGKVVLNNVIIGGSKMLENDTTQIPVTTTVNGITTTTFITSTNYKVILRGQFNGKPVKLYSETGDKSFANKLVNMPDDTHIYVIGTIDKDGGVKIDSYGDAIKIS